MEVFDGVFADSNTRIASLCGHDYANVTSSFNTLLVQMITDEKVERRGFTAIYRIHDSMSTQHQGNRIGQHASSK